jgi:hypothetical protein
LSTLISNASPLMIGAQLGCRTLAGYLLPALIAVVLSGKGKRVLSDFCLELPERVAEVRSAAQLCSDERPDRYSVHR